MNRLYEASQLLVASWALGTPEKKIPTSHGLLDRALQEACSRGAFPEWMRNALHFVDSRIGLQCVELPAILEWAQSAELTAAPNPSYQFTELRVSPDAARFLLRRLSVPEREASSWGQTLKEVIDDESMAEAGRVASLEVA